MYVYFNCIINFNFLHSNNPYPRPITSLPIPIVYHYDFLNLGILPWENHVYTTDDVSCLFSTLPTTILIFSRNYMTRSTAIMIAIDGVIPIILFGRDKCIPSTYATPPEHNMLVN